MPVTGYKHDQFYLQTRFEGVGIGMDEGPKLKLSKISGRKTMIPRRKEQSCADFRPISGQSVRTYDKVSLQRQREMSVVIVGYENHKSSLETHTQNNLLSHIYLPCSPNSIKQGLRCGNMYRQVSNIRRTKSQHLKDSRIVLRLSLPNPLKPDVKSRMKM